MISFTLKISATAHGHYSYVMDMTLAKLRFYVCAELHDDHDQPYKQAFLIENRKHCKKKKKTRLGEKLQILVPPD